MKKNFRLYIFFTFALTIYSINAFSWGKIGHRIVAGIAEDSINAKTKLKINNILQGESLVMISNLPDFLRSDPNYEKYNSYHYINEHLVKKDKKIDPKHKNVVNGLNEFLNVIKNEKSTPLDKKIALSFIVHLIGDLHQPLHVGYQKDLGGNNIQVKWFGLKTNLHSVWDEKIIQLQELSYTEYIKFLYKNTQLNKMKLSYTTPHEWALESKSYLKNAYEFKEGRYWEYKYNFKHLSKLNERLFMAGKRLGMYLNKNL